MCTEGWRCGRHKGWKSGASTSSRVRVMELLCVGTKGWRSVAAATSRRRVPPVLSTRVVHLKSLYRSPVHSCYGWQLVYAAPLHETTRTKVRPTVPPGASGRVRRRVGQVHALRKGGPLASGKTLASPAQARLGSTIAAAFLHPGRLYCISGSTTATPQRSGEQCCRGRAQRQSTEAEQDGCRPQLSQGGPAKAKAGPQQFIATHVRISTSDELERRRYLINRKQGAPVARRRTHREKRQRPDR